LTGEIQDGDASGGEKNVGERIRRLRTEKGVSLEDLAQATGFSTEQLTAFEKGNSQPQLGTLMKLSRALDTVFGQLLSGEGAKQLAIMRKDQRVPYQRSATSGQKTLYTYFSLASEVKDRHMEPLIVHLEESPDEKLSVHDGEEFIHVLDGRVKLVIDEETYELLPGDSVYYHSSLPHMITAAEGTAVILAVLYE